MSAKIIDGKSIAERLREDVAADVRDSTTRFGFVPGLAVVLVGNDPASEVYVASKAKQTIAAGMRSFEHRLSADISQGELLELIEQLNLDAAVDGILVQLPLPGHIDTDLVVRSISPAKDVDGFHPENAGQLARGAA